MAEKIGAIIKIPRITTKQKNRSNYETDSAEHYYRLSIFITYLDSLISSLSRRFSSTNKIAFSMSLLHYIYCIFLHYCSWMPFAAQN